MLNKNNVGYYIIDDDNPKYMEGVICGINIKPITIKHKKIKFGKKLKIPGKVTKWGIFLHLRMENGDQYDVMWELESSAVSLSNEIPFKLFAAELPFPVINNKKKRKTYSIIPTLFKICNANEWVEMIGKHVELLIYGNITSESYTSGKLYHDDNDEQHGFSICINDDNGICMDTIEPDYYEIHPGKFV